MSVEVEGLSGTVSSGAVARVKATAVELDRDGSRVSSSTAVRAGERDCTEVDV